MSSPSNVMVPLCSSSNRTAYYEPSTSIFTTTSGYRPSTIKLSKYPVPDVTVHLREFELPYSQQPGRNAFEHNSPRRHRRKARVYFAERAANGYKPTAISLYTHLPRSHGRGTYPLRQ